MCDRVGAKYEECVKIDNGKQEWLHDKYQWTKAEEDDFRDWLMKYIKKNKTALKMGYANKRQIENTVGMHILNYGWKYKAEEVQSKI